MFSLSSLLSISKERVESLGDEELMLVASQFMWFHNNHVNQWLNGARRVGSTVVTQNTSSLTSPR
jgi:hypothetical protein